MAGTAAVIGPKSTIELSTGVRLAYLEAGPVTGEAAILLHGVTDSSRAWSRAMAAMHAKRPDLHIFALDQRGHGDSSMPERLRYRDAPERAFRIQDFTADLLAFMDAQGLERAAIVGHSMGSFVAQQAALDRPERLTRVVLVGSSDKGAGNPVLRDFLLRDTIEGRWRPAIERKGILFPSGAYELTPDRADPEIARWLAEFWGFHPVADPAFVTAMLADTARVRIGTWLGATRGLLAFDNRERLRQLSVPALAIWGSQDAIFVEDPDQRGLLAALDAAAKAGRTTYRWKQYGRIPLPASGAPEDDIGHDTQWDAPDEIAADIVSFMETGEPTPDLYRSDAPANPRRIVTERGKARILRGP
jgi:pimeloyl-ACP methyl ester carboxylesterase